MKSEELYLSLGSNQGDAVSNLLQALVKLAQSGVRICEVSSVYQTEPVGYREQDDFLNMVVRAAASLEPAQLLTTCQATELELGRVRSIRWGPRTIDIDILFYGNRQITTADLQIPHPRLTERAFVLLPLKEIAPEKFSELGIAVPEQKVSLKISGHNVKIMLRERGLLVG